MNLSDLMGYNDTHTHEHTVFSHGRLVVGVAPSQGDIVRRALGRRAQAALPLHSPLLPKGSRRVQRHCGLRGALPLGSSATAEPVPNRQMRGLLLMRNRP